MAEVTIGIPYFAILYCVFLKLLRSEYSPIPDDNVPNGPTRKRYATNKTIVQNITAT